MTEKTNNKPKAHLIEFIMFFTYAFFAVNWIAGSTLTPQIMDYFNLENFASATFVSNAITIAKIIGNLLAAQILNKLLPKKSIALGSFLIVLGSAIAIFAPAYSIFVIGRFIMGFGGALYIVYFNPIVIHYFTKENRPTMNALNAVCYNVGSIIALLLVKPVISWLSSWQYSLGFFALISAILLVLWLVFGENFSLQSSDDNIVQKNYSTSQALKEKFNWIFPLSYCGVLTFYIVLLTMFPLSQDVVIEASKLSTLVAIGGVAGTLAAISLSKKYTKRLPVIRYSGLLMSLLGFLMVKTSTPGIAMVAAFFIGFFMFLPMTSLMTIPQEMEGVTPAKITTIMGIFWSFAYIFETIVYYILGITVDKTGDYKMAINIAIILSLTMFIGSFFLPETGGKKA